MAVLW